MNHVTSIRRWATGAWGQRAFRWATTPYRVVRHWQCARRRNYPIAVLFYHRVADREPNPWTIDNASFHAQIDWLQAHFDLLGLGEAQRRIREGDSGRPAVCITFDDGYAENLDRAIPLLLERGIPCTYFVAWSFVATQQSFPHDIARGAPLPVNSERSIRGMAEVGIEIGSHSLTHCDFGRLDDPARLQRELVDSKRRIEDCIGRPVRSFAFPYGQRDNLSSSAFAVGAAAGYAAMCTAYGGYNYPHTNPFHLQRIHGDPCLEHLKNWLTFDPRIERLQGYDWAADRSPPTCELADVDPITTEVK